MPASTLLPPRAARGPRLWRPERVLFTPAALEHEHGRAIRRRVDDLGLAVEELRSNRLTGLRGNDDRSTYRRAKRTLAVVTAPPSALRLSPIPPSADFALHLAEGCPGHCQYCYLAGSLSGPPVVRAFANLGEVLDAAAAHERPGEVTSFECSCYTDPLALEHLTGSLAGAVEAFARRPGASLRWTTKYGAVEPLLGLDHGGRTQIRFSLNAPHVADRFEGGTDTVAERLRALRRVASAGYPVGIVVAPVMPGEGWRTGYGELLDDVARALDGVDLASELTVELISHRFTPTSKAVQQAWYPRTSLDLDEATRSRKRGRFGSTKFVYPRDTMTELRSWFEDELPRRLPGSRLLYWT